MARARDEQKDAALVEAAIVLFLERGVKKTTIQHIASAAGVAVGTVYLYHKDKQSIIRRVALAIAEQHREFAANVLASDRSPAKKLTDYVLGLYDIWKPFGENTHGAIELAEAILQYAPEAPGLARKEFSQTVKQILDQAKREGMRVKKPAEEARWVYVSTLAFFPMAGSSDSSAMGEPLSRKDLVGLLGWMTRNMEK